MKAAEEKVTTFLHSRKTDWLLLALSVIAVYVAHSLGKISVFDYDKGLGLPSPNLWFGLANTSFYVGVLSSLVVCGLMMYICGRFNLLRDITKLYTGLFLVMQVTVPSIMGQFYGGTLLVLIGAFSVILLYSSYNRPRYTRRIFLIFCMLSVGALSQYAFIAYMPIFLMGCGQMRTFTFKTFLAAGIGVLTPVWILWAFGWLEVDNFHGPSFVDILNAPGAREIQFLVTVIFTFGVGFAMCVLNMVKVFSYNTRARAYNGFIALLLFATCTLIVVDFTNIPFYVPLLNFCVALQAAQFFIINRERRSYIVISAMLAVYTGLYIWNLSIL